MAYQQSRNKFKLLMLCSWASAVRYQTNSLKSLHIILQHKPTHGSLTVTMDKVNDSFLILKAPSRINWLSLQPACLSSYRPCEEDFSALLSLFFHYLPQTLFNLLSPYTVQQESNSVEISQLNWFNFEKKLIWLEGMSQLCLFQSGISFLRSQYY